MTENIGGPSAPYNVTIPSITDNADIQTALRLYHYGSDTSSPGVVPEESIAGHLSILENSKIPITPGAISASDDLNSYTTTGFYVQVGTPTGPNYPVEYSGMLTVVSNGGTIFQQYQVIGASETGGSINSVNRTYWRFYSGTPGTWKSWRTYVDSSDFANLGDARYYTRTLANSLFATQTYVNNTFLTIEEANNRQYVAESVVGGTSYTLQLSDTSKVVAIDSTGNFTLTIPLNSSVDFPIGTIINVYALNTHIVKVQGATGVTLRPFSTNNFNLFGQYTEVSLRKRGTNEWVASGNILEV